MAHDEFPPLTRSGIEVLQHANTANYEDRVGPGGVRPFAAAVIREAVKKARPFIVLPGGLQVLRVADLLDIANNLHDPPPPPPTLDALNQAVRELDGWDGGMEIRTGDWIRERLSIVRRGIAHHCKEQP